MLMPTKHLLIKGKVKGVFFRASARDAAEKLGLTGWVRNTAEGDVEAKVTGTAEGLQKFVAWCHEGPSRANVTRVEVTDVAEEDFDGFAIIRG